MGFYTLEFRKLLPNQIRQIPRMTRLGIFEHPDEMILNLVCDTILDFQFSLRLSKLTFENQSENWEDERFREDLAIFPRNTKYSQNILKIA